MNSLAAAELLALNYRYSRDQHPVLNAAAHQSLQRKYITQTEGR